MQSQFMYFQIDRTGDTEATPTFVPVCAQRRQDHVSTGTLLHCTYDPNFVVFCNVYTVDSRYLEFQGTL